MEKAAEQPSCGYSSYTYQVSRHSAEMLHNLNAQRKDGGRFCDVVLRVGEESFPAHRAVLAACSDYFESVFSCQAAEGGGGDLGGGDRDAAAANSNNNNRELEMHTISPKVFRDILDFAYTSRIVVRLECFPELMTAAKFLLMRSVIEICQEVIKQSNVQILVPTARGGDASLFQAAIGSLSEPPGFQQQQQHHHGDHVMVNGTGSMLLNGMPSSSFANNGQTTHHVMDGSQNNNNGDDMLLGDDDDESSMPVLQPVDGLPLPGDEEEDEDMNNSFHDSGGGGGSSIGGSPPGSHKRGRGRPKKGTPTTAMEPLHFNHHQHRHGHATSTPIKADVNALFPCRTCGKAFTEPQRLKNHEAQHGAATHNSLVPTEGHGITLISHSHSEADLQGLENGVPLLHGLDHNVNRNKRERTRRHVGCDICGKVFRDVYHLNRHKLSHSGEKPYACHVCGLRFKRKDRMSYHVRSHDGSVGKPYVCQSCGKGFSRPDHLNGHIKQVHTTERPHKCQICNASFATRDRLRSHLACHEDKIPCKICGKFLRAAYMTDHLKKHSEGNHNYCGICNKGFSTASYLKVHIKAHHSSPLPHPAATVHVFPESRGGTPMHNGTPYHTGRQCSVEDLCASHQLLVTFPEAEGRFHSRLSGTPVLPQPGPLQPELLLGKSGGAPPYFWECRSAGAPGFPFHGPLADGQENAGKCPHLESDESDPSFGELSNGSELKSPHKPDGEELEMSSLACNGPSAGALASPEGSKAKTDPEKKFACGICGQAFRTKSYLNKHQHRVHKTQKGQGGAGSSGLGELAPTLSSPFSPQQNMSLLESFGFQIVQSAFAASLVDPEAGQSGMDFGGK